MNTKTYKITLTFNDPYIGSRNGGDKILSTGLTRREAYGELLDLYNEKFGDERSYAPTWSVAVKQSEKTVGGALATLGDGTRQFSWDGRTYSIEREVEQ